MHEREFHPVSNLFPLLGEEELAQLAADIQANGLIEPIWVHPVCERIIDGRNRYLACQKAGVEPRYRTWDGDGSLLALIWSLNGARRHLTVSQKAAIGLEMEEQARNEAAELRQKSIALRSRDEKGRLEPSRPKLDAMADSADGRWLSVAARTVGVSKSSIGNAAKIKKEAPELIEKIRSGEVTIQQAQRQIKEAKREQRREENRAKVEQTPALDVFSSGAKFATILLDPPWDWGDEGDEDQLGRARPTYQTIGIDDLVRLPVGQLADADCHIYLWITNRSLPKGFSLLEAWGFRYITCLTWVKPSFGMGNYFRGQQEHILFGVKGSQPLKVKNASTVLTLPRGPNGHSSKPIEIYGLIETWSPGPYVELFSRVEREGWKSWGADAGIRV